jgi:hypothetical protein
MRKAALLCQCLALPAFAAEKLTAPITNRPVSKHL